MTKTIIGVYGRAAEGKSQTIRNTVRIFEQHYSNAVIRYFYIENGVFIQMPNGTTLPSGDILATIQLGQIKIGIESQGDPNSRMLYAKTIEKLANPSPQTDEERLLGNIRPKRFTSRT